MSAKKIPTFGNSALVYGPFGQSNMDSTHDFGLRPDRKETNVLLQFNQNNGIELAEKQTKQSRTLHSYGISGITASRYFFRTQFPSLGFFINKKVGNRKN